MAYGKGQDRTTGTTSPSGVIVKPDPATRFVGQSINQQGNLFAFKKHEPGRIWRKIKDVGRPVGFSNARYSTGVNPEDAINDSPYWPRP